MQYELWYYRHYRGTQAVVQAGAPLCGDAADPVPDVQLGQLALSELLWL